MEQRAIRVGGPRQDLPAYLRSAVDYILTNLAETLLLDDIAAAAGVSKRTLHLAFQMNFGLAVMAFVRQHRLDRANRQLLDGDVESTTVTSVAMNCGFQHLSRFSAIYRDQFGEYPSETLRRPTCEPLVAAAAPPSAHARRRTKPIGSECPVLSSLSISRTDRAAPRVRPKTDAGAPSAAH